MFRADQKVCQEIAASSPEALLDTIMFVSISIRVQTGQLEQLFLDFKENGEFSNALYGFKHQTLADAESRVDDLFKLYKSQLLPASRKRDNFARERTTMAMMEFLKIHGLGMAKAGFLTQLTLGKSWCADINNLRWHGIDYRKYHVTPKTSWKVKYQKIDAYLNLCDRLGGTAHLWNKWCRNIAKMYPKHFPTAQDVSALHWRVHDTAPTDSQGSMWMPESSPLPPPKLPPKVHSALIPLPDPVLNDKGFFLPAETY